VTDTRTATIIAAYNASATIERAVASALAEPETAEVCVVDDASADHTAELVERLARADARVTLIRQTANAGPAAARNRAIEATASPWIAVLDADDYVLPGRSARLHARSADADFVAGTLMRVREGEQPPAVAAFIPQGHQLTFTEFIEGNFNPDMLTLGFLQPIMRRDFIDAHGLRYHEGLRLGEDYDFYARAILHGARFLLLEAALGYVSVIRPGSISHDHTDTDLLCMRDRDDAFQNVRPLSVMERRTPRRHWVSVDCRLQWRRLISAVKARDLAGIASTFRSPRVSGYLALRLVEQAWLRSAGGLFAQRPIDASISSQSRPRSCEPGATG
jgi:succinoglycan biosynthesis protein ExoU